MTRALMTGLRALAAAALTAAILALPAAAQPGGAQEDNVAGPYVPTPWEIVDDMLKLADIRAGDMVYDLGSGDGRLVIAAARRYGARGVGVELQTTLVDLARMEAKREGVDDRVKFVQGDLFQTDLSEANVVTLYLLPRFVTRLVPKLREELRPGARIVSHDYPLSPWPADKTLAFDVEEKEAISGSVRTTLYYYVVPARVGGRWSLSLPASLVRGPLALSITQEPDRLEGVVEAGGQSVPMRDLRLRADSIRFWLFHRGRLMHFQGEVRGRGMSGEVRSQGALEPWTAQFLEKGARPDSGRNIRGKRS